MNPTLAAGRDRAGHAAGLAAPVIGACLLLPWPASAEGPAPSWFVAGADEHPGTAFAAFAGSGAASTSGGASGGGAAGGGGSGAG